MVEGKHRNGLVTAVLVLMIIANSLSALIYLLGSHTVKRGLATPPEWIFPVLGVLCILNLVCVFALFKWKKWGFWGFLLISIVAIIVNLSIGVGFGQSLLGLVGVILLFAVLQIGKERKGWSQLE
jgi:hypothetical protein